MSLNEITTLAGKLPPLTGQNVDLNPLKELLNVYQKIGQTGTSHETHTALHLLKAVFESLINNGRIFGIAKAKSSKDTEALNTVKQWLTTNYYTYLSVTSSLMTTHFDARIRVSCLTALLNLIRTESSFLTKLHPHKQAQFPKKSFSYLVHGLVAPGTEDHLLPGEISHEWVKLFNRYDDLRYYFLLELATYKESEEKIYPQNGENVIRILESLQKLPTSAGQLDEWFCQKPVPNKLSSLPFKMRPVSKKSVTDKEDDGEEKATGIFDSESEESEAEEDAYANALAKDLTAKAKKKIMPNILMISAHKKAFQEAWLSVLSFPMKEVQHKKILTILHHQIIPYMTEPKLLMDWLVDCTEKDNSSAILALNGIFTLITKYNLEYPEFYKRLYKLLNRSIMHIRFRPRFFRLFEVFMSSTHLSAALAASFIKRLARLSLSAPPAAVIIVMPLIYNMLKAHPSCMSMIHREEFDQVDPFDEDEEDPANTNALDSSLWELAELGQHYLSSVKLLSKMFSEAMTKQSYVLEDFLDHSYKTMFDSEMRRQVRSAPALGPVPKRQPLGDSFFPAAKRAKKDEEASDDEGPIDVVSALWAF